MIFSIVSLEAPILEGVLPEHYRDCAHGREQRDDPSDRQAQNLTPGQERKGGPYNTSNHRAVVCRDFLGSGRRLEDSKDLWGGWFAASQTVENHFRSSSTGAFHSARTSFRSTFWVAACGPCSETWRTSPRAGVFVPFQRVSLNDRKRRYTYPVAAAKLYLEGRSQQEIAATLYQNVELVDGFIRNFAKIVRLAISGIGQGHMGTVTQVSEVLIEEYLLLFKEYNTPQLFMRLDLFTRTAR